MVLAAPTSAPVVPTGPAAVALERGRRLYETGMDLPGARAALDQALAADPALAEAYLYRALVTLEGAPVAAARADLDQALALARGATSEQVHRFYGEALADAGDVAGAQAHYEAALATFPDYPDVLYLYGRLLRGQEQLDRAIAMFEHHARLEPKGSAHHALGMIFLARGDLVRAEAELRADLAIETTCYDARVNLAGLLLDRGDPAGARAEFERSLLDHPADARALAGLGRAHLTLGDPELAVGLLRQAQDLAPDDRDVAATLSRARWKLRVRSGWPIALPFAVLAAALGAWIALDRRARRR